MSSETGFWRALIRPAAEAPASGIGDAGRESVADVMGDLPPGQAELTTIRALQTVVMDVDMLINLVRRSMPTPSLVSHVVLWKSDVAGVLRMAAQEQQFLEELLLSLRNMIGGDEAPLLEKIDPEELSRALKSGEIGILAKSLEGKIKTLLQIMGEAGEGESV